MMKIDLKDIIKIQHLEMEIFEEEDNDYVDYRIVKNKERAIYRRLAKTISSKEEQEKVRNVFIMVCGINKILHSNQYVTK